MIARERRSAGEAIPTVAGKGQAFALRDAEGKYLPEVLLDLDYWVLVPL